MGIRILVVEDEPQIADFIVRGLREEGFTVEHASDGNQGWQAFRTAEWNLIMLDWWLPGRDGLSLVRGCREAGRITRTSSRVVGSDWRRHPVNWGKR